MGLTMICGGFFYAKKAWDKGRDIYAYAYGRSWYIFHISHGNPVLFRDART